MAWRSGFRRGFALTGGLRVNGHFALFLCVLASSVLQIVLHERHVALTMGTITSRRRKDGSTGYTAQIRLKRDGRVVHNESETFDRKGLAQEWLRRREAELDQRRARGDTFGHRQTLAELVTWYIATVEPTAKWGRTKASDLARLGAYPIAAKRATEITRQDYIKHIEDRRAEGAGPATSGNDLVWIGQVLKSARASLGVPIDLSRLDDARHELRTRKMIAKSRRRMRRPTKDEQSRLLDYFAKRDRRSKIPMHTIMRYAMASTRREAEITQLRWADLDEPAGIAWLDDVKHPTQKTGNRRSFRMIAEAWSIINEQPRNSDRVFPYNHRSISAAFTKACKFLGIKNLRFHDLRHEATSRLFEMGYPIQEVQLFTLHESWESLRIYTNLRPENLADKSLE